MQDDLLLDLFELLLFEPSDFAGSKYLFVDFLLERRLVGEFRVVGLHVPAERECALEVLDALVDQFATLTILVFAKLHFCLAKAQVALEVTWVELNGLLRIFEHQLELFVALESRCAVCVDDVILRVQSD